MPQCDRSLPVKLELQRDVLGFPFLFLLRGGGGGGGGGGGVVKGRVGMGRKRRGYYRKGFCG